MNRDITQRRKEIGNILRVLREREGLNQEEVARVLGKSRSTYTYYEKGTTMPSYDTLVMLARLYRVSISVFDGSDEQLAADKAPYNEDWDTSLAFSDLSSDEQQLILLFRVKSRAEKKEILEKLSESNE